MGSPKEILSISDFMFFTLQKAEIEDLSVEDSSFMVWPCSND